MEDAERLGLPPEIAEQLADAKPKGFEVWPENMGIVDIWLLICGQWATDPLADGRVHFHALDYARVESGLKLAGVSITPAEWTGVRVMERTARDAMNGVRN